MAAVWTVTDARAQLICDDCHHAHLINANVRTDECPAFKCECMKMEGEGAKNSADPFQLISPITPRRDLPMPNVTRAEVPIDAINPAHYRDGKIEVWDFIADKNLNYLLGAAVKYIARAGKKDADKIVEDLKKAINYINREIRRIEELDAEKAPEGEALFALSDYTENTVAEAPRLPLADEIEEAAARVLTAEKYESADVRTLLAAARIVKLLQP